MISCENKGIPKVVATWFSAYFIKKPVDTALTPCLSLESKASHYSVKEGPKANFQVVNYLLEIFGTDDFIARLESEMAPFVKPWTIPPLEVGK